VGRVLRAERLFYDGERTLVERLGFGMAPPLLVEGGQLVQPCHPPIRSLSAALASGGSWPEYTVSGLRWRAGCTTHDPSPKPFGRGANISGDLHMPPDQPTVAL
jgi:hypothetical protein